MSVKKPASTPSPRARSAAQTAADDAARASERAPERLDRIAGWLLVALALALYLRTGARDILPGDPGEFQTAAWRFGLAHATGYPLYLIGGGLWQRLLAAVGFSPAYALNLLSALTAAAAVGVLYAAALRSLPGAPAVRRAAALLAGAWLATMPTFWSQALIAEVYALHALFVALLLWIVAGWEQSEGVADAGAPLRLTPPALVVGLSLAHHATTLLLLPALAAALWTQRARLPRSWRPWLVAALAMGAPLLLYLYIPLRATPAASPWYFPQLGEEQLALYAGGWQAFADFVSGRSISVGFHGMNEARAQLGTAWQLWRIHLGAPGIVLAAIGLYTLATAGGRRRAMLRFTLLAALLLQGFNLFYAIGDILVYYIPLYVIVALWIGFGAAQLAQGLQGLLEVGAAARDAARGAARSGAGDGGSTAAQQGLQALAVLLVLALLYFPLRQWVNYQAPLDQTHADGTRRLWESLLGAEPPQGAILVSNDRNEIVPLYYLQAVEGRRSDLAGLFPLLTPEERFADIGATLDTALAARPAGGVYLTKTMPGLEVKFALEAAEPLVRVLGPAVQGEPAIAIGQPYGPLLLEGLEWEESPAGENGSTLALRLYWRVQQTPPADLTTTTQLFDAAGARLAQNDAPPGGVFYPTSLWRPGERLVESHTLQLPAGAAPSALLVAMYGADQALLAPALNLALDGLLPD